MKKDIDGLVEGQKAPRAAGFMPDIDERGEARVARQIARKAAEYNDLKRRTTMAARRGPFISGEDVAELIEANLPEIGASTAGDGMRKELLKNANRYRTTPELRIMDYGDIMRERETLSVGYRGLENQPVADVAAVSTAKAYRKIERALKKQRDYVIARVMGSDFADQWSRTDSIYRGIAELGDLTADLAHRGGLVKDIANVYERFANIAGWRASSVAAQVSGQLGRGLTSAGVMRLAGGAAGAAMTGGVGALGIGLGVTGGLVASRALRQAIPKPYSIANWAWKVLPTPASPSKNNGLPNFKARKMAVARLRSVI